MKLIKLNAIASTNTFLKDLSLHQECENFTVVSAVEQTKGKGQFGAVWQSEKGKSLTFSVLLCSLKLKATQQFYISMYVSVVLAAIIEEKIVQKTTVKWPNDILADSYKIAGILIENTIKGNDISKSIIGIGLNVNQNTFSKNLSQATSMSICSSKIFDLDVLLSEIVMALEKNIFLLSEENHANLKEKYLAKLYKYQQPTMFKTINNTVFMGKIAGISNKGELLVEHQDATIKSYYLKEISFQKF